VIASAYKYLKQRQVLTAQYNRKWSLASLPRLFKIMMATRILSEVNGQRYPEDYSENEPSGARTWKIQRQNGNWTSLKVEAE
jgi:hypothetical protein